MTDLPILILDQDLILEAAVDKGQSVLSNISDHAVLAVEMVKPSLSNQSQVSIKSTEIVQPGTPEEIVKAEETPSENITTKGILDSIVSPIQNFITNIAKSTSNFFNNNSSVISESEKLVSTGFSEVLNSSEKVYEQTLASNLKQTEGLVETASSAVKEITDKTILEKETVSTSLANATNLIKSAEVSASSILLKAIEGDQSQKENAKSASILSGSDSKLLNLISEGSSDNLPGSESNSITNNSKASSISVKSNKLIESSDVKNLITPDKTLEKSVTMLSRTLPEAVNNLSSSVTSISPSTVNSTSSFTEGSKIDQSSSTVINKGGEAPKNQESTNPNRAETDKTNQLNEYYLQAIYSALMSGKIKVKLESY